MLTFVGLLLLVTVAATEPITKRMVLMSDGKMVAQDVVDDTEEKTVLITVGDVSQYKDYRSSVNFHDFDMGWMAMKDIAIGTCLLKPISFNKEEHLPFLFGKTIKQDGTEFFRGKKMLYWDVKPRVLTEEEIEALAGAKITMFCNTYRTYKLEPKPKPKLSGYESKRSKRCIFNCGVCFNNVDLDETDVVDYGARDF